MNKNKSVFIEGLLALLGAGLVIIGFLIFKNINTNNIGIFPCIMIALGCGIFGHYTEKMIKYFSLKNREDLRRQIKIDENDERNILIAEKSKAKAYDLMIYLFAAVLLIFSLMRVDKLQIIIIVALYLSIQLYGVYWRNKLEREM